MPGKRNLTYSNLSPGALEGAVWPDTALLTSEPLEGLSKEVKPKGRIGVVKPLVVMKEGNLGKDLRGTGPVRQDGGGDRAKRHARRTQA